MTVSYPSKRSIFKNTKFIFGVATCAIIISVATAIVVVILSLGETKAHVQYHWDYFTQDHWPSLCELGNIQSPIALEEDLANKTLISSLNFENVDYYDKVGVENDGHSVTVRLDVCNCSKPRLSGGGLVGKYVFDNVHFHWPSEHMIDGDQYDLEAHFVFYSEQYGNMETALKFPYGVTVVGVLFEETKKREHNNFKVIDDAVDKASKKVGISYLTSKGITIRDFFPEDSSFFKYTGSLTTPDCVEYVNWIVYKTPSKISRTDLRRLVRIYTSENTLLSFNNRLLQKINGRQIYLQESFR